MITHVLRTRAPLTIASAFDLHVLGPPQTFALSQDQTLQFELCSIMTARDIWHALARSVVGVATSRPRPDGVRIFRSAVPQASLWFPSSTIQFSRSVTFVVVAGASATGSDFYSRSGTSSSLFRPDLPAFHLREMSRHVALTAPPSRWRWPNTVRSFVRGF